MDTFWPGVGGNWGRWGEADERGALNLIDAERIRAAAALVRSGRALSLARPLRNGLPPYYPRAGESAFDHRMITWWGSNAGGDVQAASDRVRSECHGLEITHMDALSHIAHRGRGYGGRDFREMAGPEGVSACDITTAVPVVTRAVLADIPRLRGVDHLPPGTAVGHDELAAAAPSLAPGDALIVRTGRWSATTPEPGSAPTVGSTSGSVSASAPGSVSGAASGSAPESALASGAGFASGSVPGTAPVSGSASGSGGRYGRLSGLHPDALRFVHERDAALVGTDGPGDAFPVPVDECRLPVHVLALVYLGVHLVHSMALDALAETLAAEGRDDFMLILAPLAVPGGTGSPITPVAVI
ncbi:cyclase family protein [Actinoallomurus iriomotensis]|uniref:Cyclase n=1 Tax=Actinoallomurus iriomotensis TaxID=478107 RepID=A0A9W6RJ14_9ACTN|nr:cyclase family protein [Actinoallomurus iriomotensis]GLY75720.1 cyclase [Actinoallomurus iriomotensis]